MPRFYEAQKVEKDKGGLPQEYHAAYLVPTEENKQFLIKKNEQALLQGKITGVQEKLIISKIITYFEFIQAKKEICLLKLDQEDTEFEFIGKKVLNLSCRIFVDHSI